MKNKIIIIYLIITILFFGRLIQLEYSVDTYSVFNFNKEQIFTQYAMSGRFITAIVGNLVKQINASEIGIYLGSYFIAIVGTVLSQYKLYKIFKKDILKNKNKIEDKILNIIVPTLIIINPFIIELFLFIEKGIMILGIVFCIYSVENTIKYFETKKKTYLMISLLLMFLANCSYQGIVGIYICIASVYIIKHSNNLKEFLVNNTICLRNIWNSIYYKHFNSKNHI